MVLGVKNGSPELKTLFQTTGGLLLQMVPLTHQVILVKVQGYNYCLRDFRVKKILEDSYISELKKTLCVLDQ